MLCKIKSVCTFETTVKKKGEADNKLHYKIKNYLSDEDRNTEWNSKKKKIVKSYQRSQQWYQNEKAKWNRNSRIHTAENWVEHWIFYSVEFFFWKNIKDKHVSFIMLIKMWKIDISMCVYTHTDIQMLHMTYAKKKATCCVIP